MIQMHSTQGGRRLEITLNSEQGKDAQALDVVLTSLSRSKYDSHQAIVRQIEKQRESSLTLIRFSLNISAAGRVEHYLRHIFSKRRLYPTRGHCDLHEALARALNLRMSEVQV